MYLELALLTGFVLIYSAIAGGLERTPISAAIVYTGFGLVCGPVVLGLLDWEIDGEVLRLLAELTLALVLFLDAAHADRGVIRQNIGQLLRLLAIGLPLTIAAGFGVGALLFPELALFEIALLATMLAPTDAALGKAVVSNESLPASIRETLNFESGLNDGICVPVLLCFLALAMPESGGESHGFVSLFVEEVGIGALVGVGVVLLTRRFLQFAWDRQWITETWIRVVPAALALCVFSSAQALGGSGLIACFVGGLLFGALPEHRRHAMRRSGEVFGETLTLLTWVIFGVAVVGQALQLITWRALAYALLSLTVVRMLPVALSLTGTGRSLRDKLFIGWFGPRGLASIVFVVMVAAERLPGDQILSAVVAITVILSVLAHGLSANPLVAAYTRGGESEAAVDPASP